jgi:hypothetical protein
VKYCIYTLEQSCNRGVTEGETKPGTFYLSFLSITAIIVGKM